MNAPAARNTNACEECRFWQPFEGNPFAGTCPKVGVLLFVKNTGIIATRHNFGCIAFDQKQRKPGEERGEG